MGEEFGWKSIKFFCFLKCRNRKSEPFSDSFEFYFSQFYYIYLANPTTLKAIYKGFSLELRNAFPVLSLLLCFGLHRCGNVNKKSKKEARFEGLQTRQRKVNCTRGKGNRGNHREISLRQKFSINFHWKFVMKGKLATIWVKTFVFSQIEHFSSLFKEDENILEMLTKV